MEELVNRIGKKWGLSPEKTKILYQFSKFLIVGGLATLIDFLFLVLFVEVLMMETILSNTLSFTIALVFNYFASIKFVFRVNKQNSKIKNALVFIVGSIIGLGISNAILWAFRIINIHYLLAKIFATAVVMVFNFVTRKIFLE